MDDQEAILKLIELAPILAPFFERLQSMGVAPNDYVAALTEALNDLPENGALSHDELIQMARDVLQLTKGSDETQ